MIRLGQWFTWEVGRAPQLVNQLSNLHRTKPRSCRIRATVPCPHAHLGFKEYRAVQPTDDYNPSIWPLVMPGSNTANYILFTYVFIRVVAIRHHCIAI
jgi:hypothetical protein